MTDPLGRLPEFYGWLHEFVGKALNAGYGREENLWSSQETSRVELIGSDAILDEVVYTLANPVAAGLVSHGAQWPGVRLYRPGRIRVDRPRIFFRQRGPTPAVAVLELVTPPIDTADRDAVTLIEQLTEAREAEHRATARAKRRRFLGRRAVLAQRITDRPDTPELRGRISPRVACRDARARTDALEQLKQFAVSYRDAWRSWCAGIADVIFPPGTYLMARRFHVAVAET